jgi:uncharacterized RDD family membrane protein YckC
MTSPRGEPVGAGDLGRITPQTKVTIAPQNILLPVSESGTDHPARNGRIRPAAALVPPAPVAVRGTSRSVPGHAGVVTRVIAAAVDAAVVVVLTVLLDLAAAGARFLWSPVDFRWPRPMTSVAVVVLLLVAVVYLALGWALTGRTYGSKLMGLRVLSSRNQLLGWTRSVLRALMSVLWPVGLLWCGISRTRLSLADVVLRTVVVYDDQPYARVRDGEPPSTPARAS